MKSGTAFNPVVASLVHRTSGNRNSNSGAVNNSGTNGYAWAAVPNSAANGRNLNFNGGAVNPQNNNNRANGFPVRCVAEFLV